MTITPPLFQDTTGHKVTVYVDKAPGVPSDWYWRVELTFDGNGDAGSIPTPPELDAGDLQDVVDALKTMLGNLAGAGTVTAVHTWPNPQPEHSETV